MPNSPFRKWVQSLVPDRDRLNLRKDIPRWLLWNFERQGRICNSRKKSWNWSLGVSRNNKKITETTPRENSWTSKRERRGAVIRLAKVRETKNNCFFVQFHKVFPDGNTTKALNNNCNTVVRQVNYKKFVNWPLTLNHIVKYFLMELLSSQQIRWFHQLSVGGKNPPRLVMWGTIFRLHVGLVKFGSRCAHPGCEEIIFTMEHWVEKHGFEWNELHNSHVTHCGGKGQIVVVFWTSHLSEQTKLRHDKPDYWLTLWIHY